MSDIVKSPDLKLQSVSYTVLGYERDTKDKNTDDILVSFHTMPLLLDPEQNNLTVEDAVDIYFEIFITIIYLDYEGHRHGDLHNNNIVLRKVDYSRVYTITNEYGNTSQYVVKSSHQPVIIDWGNTDPDSGNNRDDFNDFMTNPYLGTSNHIMMPSDVWDYIMGLRYDPEVFELEYFDDLREGSIIDGDKVKYMKPISFEQ